MKRHELLAGLHRVLAPRTYVEVGVNDGRSLALTRTTSVGIDPAYTLTSEVCADVHLARTTSDEFFARRRPLAHLPRPVVDLAFIDGMHLSEYALRDFINLERYTTPASVLVFDDVLPRSVVEAARHRSTRLWTGDVYKALDVLRAHRPDLIVLEIDTTPTGTAVVLLPDATSTVLSARYDAVVEDLVVPDPQPVPAAVLDRSRAMAAEDLLERVPWARLRRARDRDGGPSRQEVAGLLDRLGGRTEALAR